MSVPAHPPTYAVVVPVKPPARGKSRLVGIADGAREDLAAAFALDTVTACLAAERVGAVLVATDDARFSAALAATGAPCIPDGDSSDLNATLRQTAAEARRRWPAMRPVALCADLPALDPADLDAALGSPVLAGGVAGFVADAAGIGTTLYSASWEAFDPRYSEGSRLAHLDAGAVEVTGPLTTLRRDVDDLPDLQAAAALGVGGHTRRVLDRLGLF
ncbi:2-phospho-L-lactate guanylyltransferase [Nocardioides sp.]|uniref:2-phospho-L-lactate guanylyltransferase n=1 Tax=Nocardioides sp. TaxID=35761 RepID=UPI003518714E